ncbi:hypothetical protein COT72_03775 [archaeon CG10_big_fil_rev_8_21_14_0_10_43_11]|nr:MAG: hypothetical protein COT72_03775 [archaeon CG10_big_fil_rev_8_21_14_0_10_43_11]
MRYSIKAFRIFKEQVAQIDAKSKKIIEKKILLLRENPFRFKAVHSKLFRRVFRIPLTIQGRSVRLIYVVIQPDVILICLLDRGNDYADLESYLEKYQKQRESKT